MLRELYIENFILIEKGNVKFDKGLNVITGETGAGKSILINAIDVVLGAYAKKDYIGNFSDGAVLQATFDIDTSVQRLLSENGLSIEEDYFTISREINTNGRNVSRINGRVVAVKLIKELQEVLADFHGQHEHQKLLTVSNHLSYLDCYALDKVTPTLEEIRKIYQQYKETNNQLEALKNANTNKDREIDLLKYQLEEIETFDLKENEYDALEKEYNYLSNLADIQTKVDQSIGLFKESGNIYDNISEVKYELEKIEVFDEELKGLSDKVKDIYFLSEELIEELENYSYSIEYDDFRLSKVTKRLDGINSLMRKYGNSIQDILSYRDELQEKLNEYKALDEKIVTLEKKQEKLLKEYDAFSHQLTSIRKDISKTFEKKLDDELGLLNMENSHLKVNFDTREQLSKDGRDKVEFLISSNLGQSFNPLKEIVSGGELSRIMLAIKIISRNFSEVQTLIFDEVDTGVSGSTADFIGKKLKQIAFGSQVITITHLPQIAAYADHHILVYKEIDEDNGKTYSKAKALNAGEKIHAVAKLMSGQTITRNSLNNARELIKKSNV